MRYFLIFCLMVCLSGCYNKIVLVDVQQDAGEENSLVLDKNTLDTQDSFEGDSQPVIEVPLP